jgi:DNA-binding response OmpR family regulator
MPKPKVLVVDDDAAVRSLVCARLVREGYAVLEAADGEAALELARTGRPDLVISDVVMPGLGGHELVRRLRALSSVPVIFLTGRVEDVEAVVGLTLGADDYVTKPFSPPELMARVGAVLRRTARPPEDGARPLRLGGLEVDRERREVRVRGRHAPLAPREFDLLLMLADKKGRPVSREDVVARFWGLDDGVEVSTRTVDQHVARLRRKLRSERGRVVTVKKAGYSLRWD